MCNIQISITWGGYFFPIPINFLLTLLPIRRRIGELKYIVGLHTLWLATTSCSPLTMICTAARSVFGLMMINICVYIKQACKCGTQHFQRHSLNFDIKLRLRMGIMKFELVKISFTELQLNLWKVYRIRGRIFYGLSKPNSVVNRYFMAENRNCPTTFVG
jgi:hypothetical protein